MGPVPFTLDELTLADAFAALPLRWGGINRLP